MKNPGLFGAGFLVALLGFLAMATWIAENTGAKQAVVMEAMLATVVWIIILELAISAWSILSGFRLTVYILPIYQTWWPVIDSIALHHFGVMLFSDEDQPWWRFALFNVASYMGLIYGSWRFYR